MTVEFLKMHGLGNDFVVVDARRSPFAISPRAVRALADRHRGIGCDSLIVMDPGAKENEDAAMRVYNADGSDGGACGNALRCLGRLLLEETGKAEVAIRQGGTLTVARQAEAGQVCVDMGAPRFDWQDIPLAERMDTRTLDLQIGPIDDPILRQPSAASMGNPHCIFWVEDVRGFDLAQIGPLVENHPLFPERTNVSLAEIRSPGQIRLRVWERGIGITQACGTAACATLAAAARRGLMGRTAEIEMDGGHLLIEWRQDDDHILKTGPAETSFTGRFDLAKFEAAGGGA